MSIELSLEDVKRVALHYGFRIEVILVHIFSVCSSYLDDYEEYYLTCCLLQKEKTIETTYTTNSRAMMQVSFLWFPPFIPKSLG